MKVTPPESETIQQQKNELNNADDFQYESPNTKNGKNVSFDTFSFRSTLISNNIDLKQDDQIARASNISSRPFNEVSKSEFAWTKRRLSERPVASAKLFNYLRGLTYE